MAFRFGRARVGMNKDGNMQAALFGLIMLAIWFFAGDLVFDALDSVIDFDDETNRFYDGYKIIGLNSAGGGIIPIVAVLAVISILLQFIRVSWN